MRKLWRSWLRRARPALRRPRWDFGTVVALIVFCVLILYFVYSPRENAATAVVKLGFVRSDGVELTPAQYATNAFGREVVITEASLLCSELFLRKARERSEGNLNSHPSSMETTAPTGRQMKSNGIVHKWDFSRGGIRIRTSGKDAAQAAKLLRELVGAYQEERNLLLPAPPGCKSMNATFSEIPYIAGMNWKFAGILQSAISAGLLGLAAALFRYRRSPGTDFDVGVLFLAWLSLLFGFAILSNVVYWVITLPGAILAASLIAGSTGCIGLATGRSPAVSRGLLRGTLVVACCLYVAYGVLCSLVEPTRNPSSACIHVGIKDPGTGKPLATGFDPRFVKAECELIQSRTITDHVVEQSGLRERLSALYGFRPSENEAGELLNRSITAKPIRGSNLIEIRYLDDFSGGLDNQASHVALAYQDYWEKRNSTNVSTQVTVTLLDSGRVLGKEDTLKATRDCWMLTEQLFCGVLVFTGALSVAWLGRKPRQLWTLPIVIVAYLLVLGFGYIKSTLTPEVYTATCHTRLWPDMSRALMASGKGSGIPRDPNMDVEFQMATSHEVLGRAVDELEARGVFRPSRVEDWRIKERHLKVAWVKEHLRIIPVEKACLLRFLATSDSPDTAAEIANLAAKAFCDSWAARSMDGGLSEAASNFEIMAPAVAARYPQRDPNPVLEGLTSGFSSLAMFTIGTCIGYAGFLTQRIRQRRAPTRLPS